MLYLSALELDGQAEGDGGAIDAVAVPSEGAIAIGRARDCALRIDDPLVSRRHAWVHAGPPIALEDLGGKNATSLVRAGRAMRVAPGDRVALQVGDAIQIGGRWIGVHDGAMARVRAAPALDRWLAAERGVIRIQTRGDAVPVLFALACAATAGRAYLLASRSLVIVVALAPRELVDEVARLSAELARMGVRGDVGYARHGDDGTTALALISAAGADAETARAGNAATPIAGMSSVGTPIAGTPIAGNAATRSASAPIAGNAATLIAGSPLTSFVGRAAELAALAAARDERLWTVAGPPGAGKTRLVMRYLERIDARVVDLADAREIDDALRRIGELPRKVRLLVLDHVEAVAGELAASILGWLRDAPALRIGLVSRVALGLPGEHVIELGGLAHDDALQLFRDRARVAGSADALVRQLDGLPLALELAAARLDVLSLAELTARLPHALALLDDESLPPRHRSLRGALDVAWAQLSPAARGALDACARQDDGFALDALAAAVGLDTAALAPTIASLRRASWLRALDAPEGTRRFAMLGVLRAYVLQHAAPSRLVIAAGGRSVALPSGEAVDLSKHAALRLIVVALAQRRRDGVVGGVTTDELLAIGWPGERVDPFAGSARVRVALSRLRSLGLRDIIVRGDDGYMLAPALHVELA